MTGLDEDALRTLIAHLAEGDTLSEAQAEALFSTMMAGAADPVQIAAILTALRVRGETVEEITGGARAMRAAALPVTAPADAIDTCGTGGDAKGTYNISTTVAFVLAGCGVPVAKHGNKAASSKSGSAEVLEALGVNLNVTPAQVSDAIAGAGVGFMMAPLHHSAMRHVAPVRAMLRIRTIFNLLGPLSNPAGARRQVLGVFCDRWLEPMAETLHRLGAEHVWVVHGTDGMDELTTTAPSHVAELKAGQIRRFTVTPEEAGLPQARAEDLLGGTPQENAAALRAVLEGEPGPYRDIVLMNAAAGLVVAGKAQDLKSGAALACEALDKGLALGALEALVRVTHAAPAR